LINKVDIKKIVFTQESQFHTLKHFSRINTSYRKQLYDNYSNKQIDAQLNSAGSKFHFDLAKNPLDLIEILTKEDVKYFENALIVEFDKSNYPDGIGEDNLIKIDKLSDEQKAKLIKDKNIYYLPDIKIKELAFQINFILKLMQDSYIVSTIFPGKFAPPFPNKALMDDITYKSTIKFWNEHCILS